MEPFRFKQFSIRHEFSAHKIGMDGVLLGAWADARGAAKVLDAGCGCGIIALMLAQRFAEAEITGLEIDAPSAAEAEANFAASPWSDRLHAVCASYPPVGKFDLIVSNPPFFDAGADAEASRRSRARQCGSLSPKVLLDTAPDLLADGGELAMIAPPEILDLLQNFPRWQPKRIVLVKNSPEAKCKRVLLQLRLTDKKEPPDSEPETLTINDISGTKSDQYVKLTKDFHPFY